MKVIAVKPNERDPEQAFVTLETGVVAWSPDFKAVEPFVGKELPEGWTQKPNKAGTGQVLLPPRSKNAPQTAYRNTKDGQAYEQERMDRRTALMQAVALFDENSFRIADVTKWADDLYTWLRASSGADNPVRPEAKPEGKAQTTSVYGEGTADSKPTPPATNLWDEARDLGLSPAKAVVMARKVGWDDVRSSTDLSDDQLRELIETRRKELV